CWGAAAGRSGPAGSSTTGRSRTGRCAACTCRCWTRRGCGWRASATRRSGWRGVEGPSLLGGLSLPGKVGGKELLFFLLLPLLTAIDQQAVAQDGACQDRSVRPGDQELGRVDEDDRDLVFARPRLHDRVVAFRPEHPARRADEEVGPATADAANDLLVRP